MPDDFDTPKHRLQPVSLENFHGLIFGTFDWKIDSVESYLGGEITQLRKRNFRGRPLKHLGMHSQIIHNNSKLKGPHLLDPFNEGADASTHII